MPRKIRCLTAVLVLALLTASAAQARSPHVPARSSGFFETLWQWLAGRYAPGLWEKSGGDMGPNGSMNKEGGVMDPNGQTSPPFPPLPGTDAGGEMDPNGRS
jgi:hypothetical protein